jgi:hypothetical protein
MDYIFKYFKVLTLSEKNIDFYKNYKYKNVDNSFLTPYYNIFWNYCQKFIPSYVHPNFVTLSGLASIFASYYFSNYKYSNYLMAFGTFFYFTVDAIDGIHARKTKQAPRTITKTCFHHIRCPKKRRCECHLFRKRTRGCVCKAENTSTVQSVREHERNN